MLEKILKFSNESEGVSLEVKKREIQKYSINDLTLLKSVILKEKEIIFKDCEVNYYTFCFLQSFDNFKFVNCKVLQEKEKLEIDEKLSLINEEIGFMLRYKG